MYTHACVHHSDDIVSEMESALVVKGRLISVTSPDGKTTKTYDRSFTYPSAFAWLQKFLPSHSLEGMRVCVLVVGESAL